MPDFSSVGLETPRRNLSVWFDPNPAGVLYGRCALCRPGRPIARPRFLPHWARGVSGAPEIVLRDNELVAAFRQPAAKAKFAKVSSQSAGAKKSYGQTPNLIGPQSEPPAEMGGI